MANPIVNIPPTGPAKPPPYGTDVSAFNPYGALAANLGAYINAKAHGAVKAWGFGSLSQVPGVAAISLGAGLTGSTRSAYFILPQYCKIPKVAVAYSSVDLFNGTETFNIVVDDAGDYSSTLIQAAQPGGASYPNPAMANGSPLGASAASAASYTAGVAQTTGPGDNSGVYGYPAQYAAVGTCLFGTDIGFSSTFFTSPSAGTGGGAQVFPTTQWDTVYAAGTILSLRGVTTASTGSVTGLLVALLIQPVDKFMANDRPIPCVTW